MYIVIKFVGEFNILESILIMLIFVILLIVLL